MLIGKWPFLKKYIIKCHELSWKETQTYLADKDNSTIDVALAAVPGWKVPIIGGAEAVKLAIFILKSTTIALFYTKVWLFECFEISTHLPADACAVCNKLYTCFQASFSLLYIHWANFRLLR